MNAVARIEAPVTFSEMERLAESIAKSQLFGMKTKEQALALMMVSQAEGRHPALAARDYDIIKGRPSKKAEAMLRDFLEASGKVEWHKLDDTIADATFSHPSGGSVRITWDHKRVQTAGISNGEMYKKYPRQMLRSRCVSEGVRTVCPAATSGMYVPEEVADFEPRGTATAISPPPAPKLTPPPAPATTLTPSEEAALDRAAIREGMGETDEEPHTITTAAKSDREWGIELVGKYKASSDLGTLMAWQEANEKIIDQLGPKAIQSLKAAYDARYAEIVATMGPSDVPLMDEELVP